MPVLTTMRSYTVALCSLNYLPTGMTLVANVDRKEGNDGNRLDGSSGHRSDRGAAIPLVKRDFSTKAPGATRGLSSFSNRDFR